MVLLTHGDSVVGVAEGFNVVGRSGTKVAGQFQSCERDCLRKKIY